MVDLSKMKKQARNQIILREVASILITLFIAFDFAYGYYWIIRYQQKDAQASEITRVPATAVIKTYQAAQDPSVHADFFRYHGYIYINVYRAKHPETFHQVRLKETEPIQSSKISAQMEYERVAPGSSEADMGVDVEILSKHGIFYQKHFAILQGSSSSVDSEQ